MNASAQKQSALPGLVEILGDDDDGQDGRDEIAARLAKCCFVKVHQFEKPGTQPERLSAEDVTKLFGGVA
jgi:hypothetical protein